MAIVMVEVMAIVTEVTVMVEVMVIVMVEVMATVMVGVMGLHKMLVLLQGARMGTLTITQIWKVICESQ